MSNRWRPLAQAALSSAEWGEVSAEISRSAGIEADPSDLSPFRAFWLHLGADIQEPLTGARCNLGGGSMALMPDGTVFPCRRLPVAVGNALEEPFARIRERLAEFEPGDGNSCRALAAALS